MKPKMLQEADEELRLLAEHLVSASKRGRNPLFVIGAGVSNAAGIPLMKGLMEHLGGLIDARAEGQELTEIRSLLERSKVTRSRSSIALLFSALQEPGGQSEVVREVWSQFCRDLMAGRSSAGILWLAASPDRQGNPALCFTAIQQLRTGGSQVCAWTSAHSA